ncbi:MAG: hypothetical protein INR72_15830, partial [Williamsia herbipolensis]|nr:hypothetical protein [Williamsia herbipolensis]
MTGPGAEPAREPAPEVSVTPVLQTSAGTAVTARITVVNRASEPRVFAVTALGVDASWLPRPSRSHAVQPGEAVVADLTFVPSTGTLPARYPIALAVEALHPTLLTSAAPTAIADTTVIVDAPGQIEVDLDPADRTGRLFRRTRVHVRNVGHAPEQVRLEVQSAETARVRLATDRVTVAPGHA